MIIRDFKVPMFLRDFVDNVPILDTMNLILIIVVLLLIILNKGNIK